MERTALFLFAGGWGDSHVEQSVGGAHRAAARDLLEILLQIPSIDPAVVATDDPVWAATLDDLAVEVVLDPSDEPFHFGRRLVALTQEYDAERVLYTGGGSAPLMTEEQWTSVVRTLGQADRLMITNNLHSSDWVGFVPAQEAVPLIVEHANDNAIAWTMANDAEYPAVSMEASASFRFDVDTPLDMLIVHRHPQIGPHLRRYLDQLGWELPQLDAVLNEMTRQGRSLIVAGRVSSAAWRSLEASTQCWTRVFAEERGMRASGRQRRGEVRSLLADYLDLIGTERFFQTLSELADAVLLDNRVILASHGLWPSAADRFNADLHRWEEVTEPFLRRLTRAAAGAPIPVVMGGHSIVAGGLMALTASLAAHEPRGHEANTQ